MNEDTKPECFGPEGLKHVDARLGAARHCYACACKAECKAAWRARAERSSGCAVTPRPQAAYFDHG